MRLFCILFLQGHDKDFRNEGKEKIFAFIFYPRKCAGNELFLLSNEGSLAAKLTSSFF